MDFNEAIECFRSEYGKLGFEWTDSGPRELIFSPTIPGHDIRIRISEEEILEYAKFINIKSDFEPKPGECSICSMNYREHMLEIAGNHYLTKIFIKRNESITIEDPNSESYAEIGPASMNFINYFRFESDYQARNLDNKYEKLYDMIKKDHYAIRDRQILDFRDFQFMPTTIRVCNLENMVNGGNMDPIVDISSRIINACLLKLSCENREDYQFKMANK
jgi:hypothetical protein